MVCSETQEMWKRHISTSDSHTTWLLDTYAVVRFLANLGTILPLFDHLGWKQTRRIYLNILSVRQTTVQLPSVEILLQRYSLIHFLSERLTKVHLIRAIHSGVQVTLLTQVWCHFHLQLSPGKVNGTNLNITTTSKDNTHCPKCHSRYSTELHTILNK